MIGMGLMLCPVNEAFHIKNISLLGLTLTRLSSNMSGFLLVLKTGQAGTRSESLSDFIFGRLFISGSQHGHATVDAVITERSLT